MPKIDISIYDIQDALSNDDMCYILDNMGPGANTRVLNHILAHKTYDPHYVAMARVTELLEECIDERRPKQ